MTLEEKVKQIIVESLHSNESEVTPNAHIVNDLGAESLDQAELMMNIEDAFKDYIKESINDDESSKLDTVGSIVEFLRAKGVPEEV
jgi:acyl carrier protein